MRNRCKVVMLPTEKAERLTLRHEDNQLLLHHRGTLYQSGEGNTNQHLYIISETGSIKKWDWFYDVIEGKEIIVQHTNHIVPSDTAKKVIASTHPDLTFEHKLARVKNAVPKIPESFIEAYVKSNGQIGEVMVEYGEDVIAQNGNSVIISLIEEEKTPKEWTELVEEREAAYRLSIGVIEMKNRQIRSKDREINDIEVELRTEKHLVKEYKSLLEQSQQELQRLREGIREIQSRYTSKNGSFTGGMYNEFEQLLTTSKEG